jgi:hypothetical protein
MEYKKNSLYCYLFSLISAFLCIAFYPSSFATPDALQAESN